MQPNNQSFDPNQDKQAEAIKLGEAVTSQMLNDNTSTEDASSPAANQQAVSNQQAEPPPDVNSPTSSNEEQVDPNVSGGQREILIIRRHPFGLVALYFQAALGTAVALGLILYLLPKVVNSDTHNKLMGPLMAASIALVALVLVFMIIATYIYHQNSWVVSDDTIHQMLQRGLFNHQTSELSMANIEDVTAEQKGILAELFGFGTLRCETAGELPYFHFQYCPSPDKYAKIILDARERFINESPEQAKRANDLLNVPGGFRR